MVAFLAAIPLLAVREIDDASPWLHLRIGEFLRGGGRFGQPDPWAPFASHAYVPGQWLPSVVMAQAYDALGPVAITWSRGIGITALAAALLWALRAVCPPQVAVPVTALTLWAAWPGLAERPQLAGFVLLVPVIGAWWRTALDHRARWWVIPLTWLAACCHGVWSLGVGVGGVVVLGLLLARQLTRGELGRLAAVLGGSVAAAGLTPVGPALLLTPFSVGSNGRAFVTEWFPSSVRSVDVAVVLVMLGAVYATWALRRERPALWRVGLLVVAIGLNLTMHRTVAVGAFLAALLLAEQLTLWWPRPAAVPSGGGWRAVVPYAVGLLLAGLVAVPLARADSHRVHKVPASMTERVRALPDGARVVADSDITGWLLFEAPQVQPLFDVRIESYDAAYITRYIGAVQARPGWRTFIDDGQARVALLPSGSPLGLALQQQLGWRVVERADGFELLEVAS